MKKNSRKRIKKIVRRRSGYIEYLIVAFMVKLFSVIPYRLASDIGALIGRLSYFVDVRHRNLSARNLSMAFPEKDNEIIFNITKMAYENLGRSAAEIMHITSQRTRTVRETLHKWTMVEGKDNLDQAVKAGKGIIYLTAHLGNWELLGITVAANGYPLNVVARPIDNPRIDRLVASLRSITGAKILPKSGSLRDILRKLKNGEGVGILLDQNTSKKEGVFVDFFGRSASTNRGPTLIAMKTGAPVIPLFSIREDKYRHRIIYGPEIKLYMSGDVEKDVVINTEKFTKVIESYIRKYPEQWFWMHNRWKTRP